MANPKGLTYPPLMSVDPTEPRVHGEVIVYRLFDVGYAIALDRAFEQLSSSAPERRRPSRGEAQTIRTLLAYLEERFGA